MFDQEMIDRAIEQLDVPIDSMEEVEDSHSSTVYKCTRPSGENAFLKIPYTKLKFQREWEAYQLLKGKVTIPEMLAYWPGDAECFFTF